MKKVIELIKAHPGVSDYKTNSHRKESYELFYVKGNLETVRCTDTCDKEVTVYVDHGDFRGNAQFFIYPSTDPKQMQQLLDEAVEKAFLINNKKYELPDAEQGEFEVESNFADYTPVELASGIARTVFEACTIPNASLNSVEVFVTKHTRTIENSRGLSKSEVSFDAMVEAIPTYNAEDRSVELYQQYNFNTFDRDRLAAEIANKLEQVKARCEAVSPSGTINCDVVLHREELESLFSVLTGDLNYASVYSRANLFKKGDAVQKDPQGDLLNITMAGEAPGCVNSTKFDSDGMSLKPICVVGSGTVVNYYGSNRYGQYLNEEPTGNLDCIIVEPGSFDFADMHSAPHLEVLSMSGLQVDLNSDYIGGEIRLAYLNDGTAAVPVTGISFSGVLSEVLNNVRLSKTVAASGGYLGPDKALLTGISIF